MYGETIIACMFILLIIAFIIRLFRSTRTTLIVHLAFDYHVHIFINIRSNHALLFIIEEIATLTR